MESKHIGPPEQLTWRPARDIYFSLIFLYSNGTGKIHFGARFRPKCGSFWALDFGGNFYIVLLAIEY
jgi:flagellar biosynthesis regulator FlbT